MAATYSPAEIVSMAWDKGMAKSDAISEKTEGYFDAAMGRAGAAASMLPAYLNFQPVLEEPDVAIPKLAEGASAEMFEQWWTGIVDKLAAMYGGYMDTYFPNDCDYLQHAQEWICDAITKGGSGIKPQVERQIWDRDRSRILAEARRAENELIASYASRGFPMPPGAMQAGLANIQADTRNQIGQASRDRAIQQSIMEAENVRFAIGQAVSLYSTAIGAARDYMAAMAGAAGTPAQLLPSVTDSQSRLISAASGYYQTRISAQELRLRAAMPNAEWQQQANVQNLEAQKQSIQNMVNAAVEAAKALSTQAAAMLNALHVSSSTGATGGHSVSYSYSGEVTGAVPPHTV